MTSPINQWQRPDKKIVPMSLTPLIGREEELAHLSYLLHQSEVRLITLTGPGGVGKTRLALQVASSWQKEAQSAYFVALETVSEPQLVLAGLAQALGLQGVVAEYYPLPQPNETDIEETTTSSQNTQDQCVKAYIDANNALLEQLTSRLSAAQPTLVVLDNLEQIIQVGPVLVQLLSFCPSLKLLVTSREALRVSGEYLFEVKPLSLPAGIEHFTALPSSLSLAHLQAASAITLFVKRVQQLNPAFSLTEQNGLVIAQICQRLDGLPLALELTAARTRLFSLAELLTQLQKGLGLRVLTGGKRNLAQRQQTLRATLAWSYQLLSEAEQTLFRRLAVFKGGFSLQAIQTICNEVVARQLAALPRPLPLQQVVDGKAVEIEAEALIMEEDGSEVLDLLASLIEKSLVTRLELTAPSKDGAGVGSPEYDQHQPRAIPLEASPSRFSLLELVREYAAEQLAQTMPQEDEVIAERHAAYFTNLAKMAHSHLSGSPHQPYWLTQLEMEQPNLVAALDWLISRYDLAQAIELSLYLGQFWILHGHLSYARRTLTTVLAQLEAELPRPKMWEEGEVGSNGNTAPEPDHSRTRVTPCHHIQALLLAAKLARLQGELAQAQNLVQASERLSSLLLGVTSPPEEEPTRDSLNATLLVEKGHLAVASGQYQMAQSYFEQSLALYHSINVLLGQAEVYARLGMLAENRSEYVKASDYYRQSLELASQLGTTQLLSQAFTSLGRLQGVQGHYDEAHSYYTQALKGYRLLDYSQGIRLVLNNLGVLAKNQGQLKEARHYYQESLELARIVGDQQAVALTLANLGQVAQIEGEYEEAAKLAEESLNLCRQLAEPKRTAHALLLVGSLARQQHHYAQSKQAYRESLVLFHSVSYERGSAEALAGLAEIEAAQDQLEEAIRLWGLAEGLREKYALSLPPVLKPEYERQVQAARQRLGEVESQRSWISGRSMSIEQVLALAGAQPTTENLKVNQGSQGKEERKAHHDKATREVGWAIATLTGRETEVLKLVALGLTNVQIAQKLILSQRTVNSHLTAIFSKLGVNTRSAATRWAIDHHLT